MDRWARLEGGVVVVLDLRSSYAQVAGDVLERLAFHQRYYQGSAQGSDGRRDNTAEALSE
jgi:hypothetical protein